MPFKKLLFGFLFLISFTAFHWLFFPLFTTYNWVFGLGQETLILIFSAASLLLLSSICFALLTAFSQDLRLGMPFILLGAGIPLIFSQNVLGIVLAGGFGVVLSLYYFAVSNALRTYITFSPTQLLSPHIKTFNTLLLLIISIGFYLSINSVIKQEGFKVPETLLPDELIEQVIQSQSTGLYKGERYLAQLPSLTPEQIQLLRQNPELLKQYGVDPSILDQFEKPAEESLPASTMNKSNDKPATLPQSSPVQVPTSASPIDTTTLVKNMVFEQINTMAKQYEYLLAPILAVMVWSIFAFANFFLYLLINPLLWILFSVLEKSEFVRFVKSTRVVKRLVV